jgi:uncharacterized protein YkwD
MRAPVVIVVAIAAAVVSASAAPAGPVTSSSGQRLTVLEVQVLRELNRVRAAHGLAPLRSVSGLRSSAARHTEEMLTLGFFSHASADGTAFSERIRRHYTDRGWETWSVAETLLSGSGAIGARAIASAWVASPPHRRIIMSSGWRDAGIAARYRPDAPGYFRSAEATVITADFGYRAGRLLGSRSVP